MNAYKVRNSIGEHELSKLVLTSGSGTRRNIMVTLSSDLVEALDSTIVPLGIPRSRFVEDAAWKALNEFKAAREAVLVVKQPTMEVTDNE